MQLIEKEKRNFIEFLVLVFKRAIMMVSGRKHEPVSPPQINIEGNPANPIGWVLISYIAEIYKRDKNDPWVRGHANRKRALIISGIFQEFSYAVDVIDCNDISFIPNKKYDILFGHDPAFPILASKMPETKKVFYSTVLPEEQYNKENEKRFQELKSRRGIRLKTIKRTVHNSCELADYIFYIGNEKSLKYFSNFGIDITKILRVSTGRDDFIDINPKERSSGCLKNFLYVGSWNPISRGLDRLVEVFASMPEYNLIICSDLLYNAIFALKFRNELFFTKNIYSMGFVDTGSQLFSDLVKTCAWQIYPSGSEAAASSVVLGIRSGLVPIISEECSLDIGGYGWIMPDCSIDTIKNHVIEAGNMPYSKWLQMSRSIKEFSEKNYSLDNFKNKFRDALSTVINGMHN